MNSNEIILPERPDLSWSRNFANLQSGEICNSTVKDRKEENTIKSYDSVART